MKEPREKWSEWFNIDSPVSGFDDGDYETTREIQQLHTICPKKYEIISAECQIRNRPDSTFNYDSPVNSLEDVLWRRCTVDGLICRNRDQMRHGALLCQDYSIRYRCERHVDEDGGYLPQFDVRIYIVLAVVPVLIFLVRMLWAFVCKQRRQRRRTQRRAQRRLNPNYDDDSSSISSGLANPPPSYQDLFGKTGHLGSGSSVFAISRDNIPICSSCQKVSCSVADIIGKQRVPDSLAQDNQGGSLPDTSEYTHEDSQGDMESSGNNIEGTSIKVWDEGAASAILLHDSSYDHNLVTNVPSPKLNEFVEIDLQLTPSTTCLDAALPEHPDSFVQQGQLNNESESAHCSEVGQGHQTGAAAATDVTLSLNPSLLSISDISQPCPCPCHRTIPLKQQMAAAEAYDNQGFAVEPEEQHNARLPGMHVPVVGLHRVWSDKSVSSVELPSYDLAVELMKKRKEQEANGNEQQNLQMS